MSDLDAIRNLTHRYADAICRRDADAWAGTWAPDAVWDMGGGRVSEGRETVVDTWVSAMAGYPAVAHFVMNGTADLDPQTGTGRGRWYLMEYLAVADGSRNALFAYYDDEYVRIDDEWLFARRTLNPVYAGPADMPGRFLFAAE